MFLWLCGSCVHLHPAPQRLKKDLKKMFLRSNANTSWDCGHYPWTSLSRDGKCCVGSPTTPWEVLDHPAMEHPYLWSTHAYGVSLGMTEGLCPPILPGAPASTGWALGAAASRGEMGLELEQTTLRPSGIKEGWALDLFQWGNLEEGPDW